uniref:Uncharacterized protein n=1 Tax=Quercus lobata TaxID=97700 RepID=A0A7N2L7Z6_QUELO
MGVATAAMMATKEDDNDNEIEVEEANNTEDFRHIDVDMQKCLLSVLNIGILCSLESPKERINMEEVIKELQMIKSTLLVRGFAKLWRYGLEQKSLAKLQKDIDRASTELLDVRGTLKRKKDRYPELFRFARDKEALVSNYLDWVNGQVHWKPVFILEAQDWDLDSMAQFFG